MSTHFHISHRIPVPGVKFILTLTASAMAKNNGAHTSLTNVLMEFEMRHQQFVMLQFFIIVFSFFLLFHHTMIVHKYCTQYEQYREFILQSNAFHQCNKTQQKKEEVKSQHKRKASIYNHLHNSCQTQNMAKCISFAF